MARVLRTIVIAEALLLTAPLFLATMSFGFATWDYFTLPMMYLPHGIDTWAAVPRNWWYGMMTNSLSVRGTAGAMFNLAYLTFGGSFWLWYVCKWLGKLATVWVLDKLLASVSASSLSRTCAAVFVFFHPALFELMMTSADGWVALGVGLHLLAFFQWGDREDPLALGAKTNAQQGILWAALLLVAGLKEVVFAYALALTVALHLRHWRSPRAQLCVLPYDALLIGWVVRLAGTSANRDASVNLGEWLHRLHLSARWLLPKSPLEVLALMALALLGRALFLALHERPWSRRTPALVAIALASATGMLVMTTVPTDHVAAPRYVIPTYALLAVAALAYPLRHRFAITAQAAFVLLFPLLTAGDVYAQYLAYHQRSRMTMEALAYLEEQERAGYSPAITGELMEPSGFGLEEQETLQLFFTRYRARFYRGPVGQVVNLSHESEPNRPVVLATTRSPSHLAQAPGGAWVQANLEGAMGVTPAEATTLERLARGYWRLSRRLGGAKAPTYDTGAPQSLQSGRYYLYVARPGAHASSAQGTSLLTGERFDNGVLATFPVQSTTSGPRCVRWSGSVHVHSGWVWVGLADAENHDLYSQRLEPGEAPTDLATNRACVNLENGRAYHAYIYAPDPGTRFDVADFALVDDGEVTPLPPGARYGAFAQ